MSSGPMLAPDAAIVLGIASTAMPFARTREEEVERWLRLLRLHGQVGTALQALGVSEAALPEPDESSALEPVSGAGTRDVVALVTEHAVNVAGEHGARAITTADLLLAVIQVYGEDFDRALRKHGAERAEVLEKLGLAG